MRITYEEVDIVQAGAQVVTRRADTRQWNDEHLVLRPEFVGVCRSDLKELAGTRHKRRDFGHEVVASVVHAPSATSIDVGDWVCLDPHVKVSRGSGFTELLVITGHAGSLEQCVVPLGRSRPPKTSVFVEPLACVEHCLERMGAEDGSRWLIVGAGHAGFLLYSCLRTLGLDATLANRSRERLEGLQRSGAAPATDVELLRDVPRAAFDGVSVMTSMAPPEVIELGARALKPHGRLHVYGGTDPAMAEWRGVNVDRVRRSSGRTNTTGPNGPLEVTGSHGAGRGHFDSAVRRLGLGHSAPGLGESLARVLGDELDLHALAAALNEPATFAGTAKTLLLPRKGATGEQAP